MKNIVLIVVLLGIINICKSQDIPAAFIEKAQDVVPAYIEFTRQADSLFKIKEFKKAAITYSKAFETNRGQGKVLDRYNAASSWALSNNYDSAFFQLYRIANMGGYSHYEVISVDPNLKEMHSDKRWQPLMEIIKQNKNKREEMERFLKSQ
jgi:hypothetical protein